MGRGNDDIGDVVVLLLPSFLACRLIKWLGEEMLYVKCAPLLFSVHSHFLAKDMLCVKCISCTIFQLPAWRLLHVGSHAALLEPLGMGIIIVTSTAS